MDTGVGDGEAVAIGVAVYRGDGVGDGVLVEIWVGVALGTGVTDGVGVIEGVGLGVGDGDEFNEWVTVNVPVGKEYSFPPTK